jgi:ABC-type Zn uptake system ZnuABC Zn-binding protein ZnuA
MALAAVLALILTGCGRASGGAGVGAGSTSLLKVVATTTQIGDLVRNVGGTGVKLTQILQPNTDPHEYEPRPDDVKATAGAKLVFENGDSLDAWMAKVIEQSGGRPEAVDLGEGIPDKLPGESEGKEAAKFDPHWWHDPLNMIAATAVVRDRLAAAEPARADAFRAGAAAYTAKLHALDKGIAACMDAVPSAKRLLVTSHDAFNYFAKRFGITVVGAVIPSQTTQAQPSSKQLTELARLVKEKGVTAVFPEESLNPALARQIAKETGARADLELYGDTLGPAGSSGETYLKMEQANASAMVDAFSGGAIKNCEIEGI